MITSVCLCSRASSEVPGAPVIESYKFGDKIEVKFASKFMTKKVSEKFAKQLNAGDGWHTLTKGGDRGNQAFTADDNYEFRG